MSSSSLLREAKRVRETLAGRASRGTVPPDKVEFARACGIEPDDWQARFLRSEERRILVNCSRQSGKSLMCACKALHTAITEPGSLILLLAPALRQSQELYGKVSSLYRALGNVIPTESMTKLTLTLQNGSRIVSLPGTEKNIRGYSDAALLILDEAARIEDDLYFSVRPMLAVSGGTLIMVSTPFGRRGIFSEEWHSGASWQRFRVTAQECPRISEEFLAEERLALGEWWYRQEYLTEFMDSIDQVFNSEDVERAFTPGVKPLFTDWR